MHKVETLTVTGARKNGRDWLAECSLTLADGRTVAHTIGPYSRKRDALATTIGGKSMRVALASSGQVAYSETLFGCA